MKRDEAKDGLPAELIDTRNETESSPEDNYYHVPRERASLLWSLLSVVAATLSIFLSFFYYASIPLSIAAVVLAVVSSRRLGFFDKLACFGLIVGIFGIVFGAFAAVLDWSGIAQQLMNMF